MLKTTFLSSKIATSSKPTDYGLRAEFANDLLMYTNENNMDYVVFSDGSMFPQGGHMSTLHIARIWSLEPLPGVLELQRDSPKLNVFVHISNYGYFPQLEESEPDNSIWQQIVHRLTGISHYAIG
ncbi:hypothetical protein TNCV_2648831 [Trichonephila clavipes]|nr:hypothetical protein TNCV_2648831 [Trichonephila clavipes]